LKTARPTGAAEELAQQNEEEGKSRNTGGAIPAAKRQIKNREGID